MAFDKAKHKVEEAFEEVAEGAKEVQTAFISLFSKKGALVRAHCFVRPSCVHAFYVLFRDPASHTICCPAAHNHSKDSSWHRYSTDRVGTRFVDVNAKRGVTWRFPLPPPVFVLLCRVAPVKTAQTLRQR